MKKLLFYVLSFLIVINLFAVLNFSVKIFADENVENKEKINVYVADNNQEVDQEIDDNNFYFISSNQSLTDEQVLQKVEQINEISSKMNDYFRELNSYFNKMNDAFNDIFQIQKNFYSIDQDQ